MSVGHYATASQVLEGIRSGATSVCEVVEGQLEQIARYNPALNAIVTLDKEQALQRAREADQAIARGEIWGPLHGLPVTIKDVFETAGMRSTSSYPPLANHIPEQDAIAVARLREAGAIILGKTNLPPLASDFQTHSPLFGRTNNPWDLDRTPGGSTGGGAAAIAAGLSFLELGSDLAGSIRIPAHYCGIYGFVPTDGQVPRAGHLPRQEPGNVLGRFLRVGPLARSVEDLLLCFDVIAGPDPREPDLPPVHFNGPSPSLQLKNIRIAWSDDAGGIPVTADSRAVLQAFVARLAEQGCKVQRVDPAGFDFALARQVHNLIFMTMIGTSLPGPARLLGRYLGGVSAFDLDLRKYLQAEQQRLTLIAALDEFLSSWDAWICPVTSTPAFRHHPPSGFMGPTPVYKSRLPLDDQTVDYYLASSGFTTPLNVTGHPVVVIPAGQSQEGLPIGVQVVGRRWQDRQLLAVAALLAQAAGLFLHPSGFDG